MALTGYCKAGTDDMRCLDHVDFVDGTPVYGEFECTYCAMKAQSKPVEVEEEPTCEHRPEPVFVQLVRQRGDRVLCHYEVKKRLLANPVDEEDARPWTGAFKVPQLLGYVMVYRGDYYGQYMGGSKAGARAHMRNLRNRV